MQQDLACGIHPKLAAGSNNRFVENLELPEFSQREAEINFFPDEKRFIETADRFVILARGEKERARAEIEREIGRAKEVQARPRPKRDFLVHSHARAAASVTSVQC